MTGSTPVRMKAGRKHRPSGAAASTPTRRAARARWSATTRRWSAASAARAGANAAPDRSACTNLAAARPNGGAGPTRTSAHASCAQEPSARARATVARSLPSRPGSALPTTASAAAGCAPAVRQTAMRSSAIGTAPTSIGARRSLGCRPAPGMQASSNDRPATVSAEIAASRWPGRRGHVHIPAAAAHAIASKAVTGPLAGRAGAPRAVRRRQAAPLLPARACRRPIRSESGGDQRQGRRPTPGRPTARPP